jgi:hypothetical protein
LRPLGWKTPHRHSLSWPGSSNRSTSSLSPPLLLTSHPNDTQYCPLLAPLNQTFQEVTHLGTAPAEARLIRSSDGIITITSLKDVVVIEGESIHISTSPYPDNVGRHNHPLSGPSVPAGGLHGLVHAPSHLRLGNGSDTICNIPPQ